MEPDFDARHADPYIPNLSIGYLFSRSWPRFKDHLWLLVGTFTLYALLIGIGSDTWDGDRTGGGLLNLVAFVITGPLTAGLYWMMLKVQRDEPIEFTDLFAGFGEFGRAFGVYALTAIATLIGFILLIVPGLILLVGLAPGLFLVMDDELGVMDTLRKAWDMTMGHKLQLLALGVVLFFLTLLGILAFIIGVFFTGAFASLVVAAAYDELALAER
ncbi:MAG: hypothetical protein ABJF88_09540 [Rhodothermales bacterium]